MIKIHQLAIHGLKLYDIATHVITHNQINDFYNPIQIEIITLQLAYSQIGCLKLNDSSFDISAHKNLYLLYTILFQ